MAWGAQRALNHVQATQPNLLGKQMNKTLRIAFCGLEGQPAEGDAPQEEGQSLIMSGPLSEVMTQALNIAFAKKDKVFGTVTMESQANDAIMALAAAKAVAGIPQTGAAEAARSLQVDIEGGPASIASALAINVSQATPAAINIYAATPLPKEVSEQRLKNRASFVVVDLDGFSLKPGQDGVVFAYPNMADGKSFQNAGINMTALEAFCTAAGQKMVYGVDGLIKALKAGR